MGTYFLNPELAYQEALQQKRTGLHNDLQICYYNGEPLNSDLPNLINLPLEHIYGFMSETDYRMIRVFRIEEGSDPEFDNKIISYIDVSQKKAILKKAEFKELFKQEVRKIKLDFSEPLRIFFITTRATTVLQHCAKSLRETFTNMGYETFLSIEHNDMQSWGMDQDDNDFVWHLKNMLDFKPHITINIDYLHNDFLPDEMFNFVWFQDMMPIFDNNGHVKTRERDFIFHLTTGLGDLLSKLDIHSEYQSFLMNTKNYKQREEIKKEKKIVFIGSSYNHHIDEMRSYHLFDEIFKEMIEIFEEKNHLPDKDIKYLMAKYHRPSEYFGEINRYITRDYCVEKLCKINTGKYKVEVYGAGWEHNKHVMQWHKGVVEYGEDISKIYNSATYGYCVGGYVLMQRTLESAFSGTIPLVLDVRVGGEDTYDKRIEKGIQFFNIKDLEKILTSGVEEEKDFSFIQQEYGYEKFANKIIDIVHKELSCKQ